MVIVYCCSMCQNLYTEECTDFHQLVTLRGNESDDLKM